MSLSSTNRLDFIYLYNTIHSGSRVIDLGCGDGTLLSHLKQNKVYGMGIEKDESEYLSTHINRFITFNEFVYFC